MVSGTPVRPGAFVLGPGRASLPVLGPGRKSLSPGSENQLLKTEGLVVFILAAVELLIRGVVAVTVVAQYKSLVIESPRPVVTDTLAGLPNTGSVCIEHELTTLPRMFASHSYSCPGPQSKSSRTFLGFVLSDLCSLE